MLSRRFRLALLSLTSAGLSVGFVSFFQMTAVAGTLNWCTKSPDSFDLPSARLIFAPGCENHDICYSTFSKNAEHKTICDNNLLRDLRNICQERFVKYSNRTQCNGVAEVYYYAVTREVFKIFYDEAQS